MVRTLRATAIAVAAGAVLLLGGAVARAQGPDRPLGLDLGLRVGYAIPFGDIDGTAGNSLSSQVSGAVPFILEAGYRFTPVLTAGVLLEYAFGQVNDAGTGCGAANVSCSASMTQVAVEGLFYIPIQGPFVPWVGLATGYEWASRDSSGNLANTSFAVRGLEFITLQAGGDFLVAPRFALGPFLSYSVGRYATGSFELNGTTTTRDIADPATHEWLQLGLRGTFGL
jgi:hypothetical protein